MTCLPPRDYLLTGDHNTRQNVVKPLEKFNVSQLADSCVSRVWDCSARMFHFGAFCAAMLLLIAVFIASGWRIFAPLIVVGSLAWGLS